MDNMLGHKPSTQRAVVVDTLKDGQEDDSEVPDTKWRPKTMMSCSKQKWQLFLVWIAPTPLFPVQPAPMSLILVM